MFARKLLAGAATTALTVSAFALTAGPAHAATDADDPTFTPVAADLTGVGSDTSQHALKLLADGWNATTPTPSSKIASFAATSGGQITLPTAAINRPNGSGAGKALLYGSGNNTDIDFARSSSAISTAEAQAGLQAFPFALDTLVMAVSGSTTSNAPTSLTPAQIVSIYKGDVTNWSQLGGKDGVIKPLIPQAGSGTRSFFVAQLKAANNGVDVTLAASVTEVQEHDPSPIMSDANAVAPFSKGRAGLPETKGKLRLEDGFSANRALYDVVRGSDVGNATIQAVFGGSGYVCSNDARSLIEAAGFQQLATSAHGGVCGEPTQAATSNFTLNQQVATTTAVTASSPAANTAKIVAAVTGSTAPSGTVAFFEGSTQLATGVPLTSGQASYTATGVTAGSHTYRAVFTPDSGSVFEGSEGSGTTTVSDPAPTPTPTPTRVGSSLAETFPAKVKSNQKAKGTVTVTSTKTINGIVKVKEGSKVLASGAVKGGKVTLTLPKLKPGTHKLTVSYGGSSTVRDSVKSFVIKSVKKK